MLLTGYVIYVKLKLNFTPGGVRRAMTHLPCQRTAARDDANTAGY